MGRYQTYDGDHFSRGMAAERRVLAIIGQKKMPAPVEAPEQLRMILAQMRTIMNVRSQSAEDIASSIGVSSAYLLSSLSGKRRLAPSRLVIACRELGIDFGSIAATLNSLVGGTTYLRLSRAAGPYECSYCRKGIDRGDPYVRLEPFGPTRQSGAEVLHFCRSCSTLAAWIQPMEERTIADDSQLILPFANHVKPTQIRLVDVTSALSSRILANPSELLRLTPPQFEEFVLERLCAMGLHAQTVGGGTYRRDGGIDIIFTPPKTFPFPFLGAVQVKHHRNPHSKVGPEALRELLGVISANQYFAAGMIVTNTTFTPDARDFATRARSVLRLRDFQDLMRWVTDNFTDDANWREIPDRIQLCDGITVSLK